MTTDVLRGLDDLQVPTQWEVDQQVARILGEQVEYIARRGFNFLPEGLVLGFSETTQPTLTERLRRDFPR